MKKKKELKSRDIAGMHWFIAGFAVPALVVIVAMVVLPMIVGLESQLFSAMLFVVKLLGIWLGVKVSTEYLNKRYIIKKPKKVVQISTFLFILINGGYVAWQAPKVDMVAFAGIVVMYLLINATLFYVLSRRYIKNNEGVNEGMSK